MESHILVCRPSSQRQGFYYSEAFFWTLPVLRSFLVYHTFQIRFQISGRGRKNIFIYKVIDPSSLFKFLQVKPTYTCLVKKIVISINLSLPCAMKADISLSTRVDHRLYN